MNDDKTKAVEILLKKAAEAHDAGDAMRLSQAALNAANAICSLRSADLMKAPD
jgi:hypothetical protein